MMPGATIHVKYPSSKEDLKYPYANSVSTSHFLSRS
jgi:hypothetical protein